MYALMAALILYRPDELFLCIHRWIPLVLSLSKVNINVIKLSAYTIYTSIRSKYAACLQVLL